MDPTVRSIQVASALTDRLGVLLQAQRTSVVSTALNADLANDELALRIGEAQQITPEIWSHLDSARKTLAERGVDVGDYDAVRAERDPAMLATSNIAVEQKLDVLGLLKGQIRVITTKNVTWDAGNFVAAIAACAALKQRLPDVDWEALDRADRDQIAAVGTLKSVSSRKILALVLAIALIAGVVLAGIFVVNGGSTEDTAPSDPVLVFGPEIKLYTAAYRKDACDRDAGGKLVSYLVADGLARRALEIVERQKRCP